MPCPERFKDALVHFDVDSEVARRINEGYEDITGKSPKKVRAAYFKRAMDILDAQCDPDKLRELMDWGACCKSGAREKASKAFAKAHKDLSPAERLPLIRGERFMGDPVLNEDGTITTRAVTFYDSEAKKFQCACTNFNGVKRDYPVSKSYCYCCAGHFRHHYQIMLGVKLRAVEILSSPLDSDGANACVMRFEIV